MTLTHHSLFVEEIGNGRFSSILLNLSQQQIELNLRMLCRGCHGVGKQRPLSRIVQIHCFVTVLGKVESFDEWAKQEDAIQEVQRDATLYDALVVIKQI